MYLMIVYVFLELKFSLYLANYVQRASQEKHFNDVNENVLHKLRSLVHRDLVPLGVSAISCVKKTI